MAVYGRFRERWDPTKVKSKVSKNLTYELNGTTSKVLFWMNVESYNGADAFLGAKGEDNGLIDIPLDSFGDRHPTIMPVKAAQFQPNALYFDKIGTQRSYIQTGANELSMISDDIGGEGRTHDTWISFWVKIPQDNFDGTVGHNMGGLYRSLANSAYDEGDNINLVNPFCLFGITKSGAPELTFLESLSPGNRIRYTGDVTPSDKNIEPNEWAHVAWLIKVPEDTAGVYQYKDMVELYIDGQPVPVAAVDEGNGNPNSSSVAWWSGASKLEVLLGNQTRGFAADNSGDAGEGFWGAIGEFLIFTQPVGDATTRSNMAKFVYEAQREGAYHLHSGIHNSSPRLEQLDLDRDSLYPPNFTLENYTMGSYQYISPTERRLSKSKSRYTEGYNASEPGYEWKENASQYFQNTNQHVLPHLRLNYQDTLLSNGDWYSDARSEFFSEDLDEFDPGNNRYGFTVSDQSSDELYREHLNDSFVKPFVEFNVPEEYKDCFVIEIPLPNDTQLDLGTELDTEQSRLVYSGDPISGNVVTTSPGSKIANMAYYNFNSSQWQYVKRPNSSNLVYYDHHAEGPGETSFVDRNAIGFSPMTGIIVPNSERIAEKVVPMHGLPTSDFGFPTSRGYRPSKDQSIDLSEYIDEPVILEGWEIKTKVIPKVGYAGYEEAAPTNFDETTEFGINVQGGKSAFHYGGHGSAAVLFDARKDPTGFPNTVVTDGIKEYHVGSTIPITHVDGNEEARPPADTPGLVTSGITAFLLKKPGHYDIPTLRDTIVETFGNEKEIHKITTLGDHPTNQWLDTEHGNEDLNSSESYKAHYGGLVPDVAKTDHYRTLYPMEMQLVGWLQHVYHNDGNLEDYSSRSFWVRESDDENKYFFRDGKNIIELLDKESSTYVPELLYSNTEVYDLNVQGRTKAIGKIPRGIPVSNFFIEGAYGQGGNTTDYYVVSTSSETSFNLGDGSLGNHNVIPRYGAAEDVGKTTSLPKANFPSRPVVTPINKFHHDVKLFDSIEDDSVVILNPQDELVVGIQNSISTTFASQQQYLDETGEFIRWGRTSLTLPVATDGTPYLRLFVKKSRDDKDFNIIADSSNYNANVNRDLGDVANADKWIVSNSSLYSGSMADDIVGPSYFRPPKGLISVSSSVISGNAGLNVLFHSTTKFSSAELLLSLTNAVRDVTNASLGLTRSLLNGNTSGLPEGGEDYEGGFGTYLPQPNALRPDWFAVASWMDDFDPTNTNGNYRIGRWAGMTDEERVQNASFRTLFSTYTEAELNTGIQRWMDYDPRLDNAQPHAGIKHKYLGPTTLAGLGIPQPKIETDWTQLSNVVFSYGGPLPAALPVNLYDQIVPMESLLGFVTEYHHDRQTTGDATILENSLLFPGPWDGYTPQNTPDSLFDRYRPEGAWLLEELNPNPNAPVVTDIQEHRRRNYLRCGAVSAWYCKFKFPYFEANVLGKTVGASTVEFRFIKIDTGDETSGVKRRPRYTDGTLIEVGDCFFFDKDHRVVKLDLTLSSHVTPAAEQVFQSSVVVYIVAGGREPEVELPFQDLDFDENLAGNQTIKFAYIDHSTLDPNALTWNDLWLKIQRVLSNQKVHNPALLYNVVSNSSMSIFRGFDLVFPQDPIVQEVFEANKTTINEEVEFTLNGHDMTGISGDNSSLWNRFPQNPQQLYGVDPEQVRAGWDAAPIEGNGVSAPASSYEYGTWTHQTDWYDRGGRLYTATGDLAPGQPDTAGEETAVGNFYSHWFDRLILAHYFCGHSSDLGQDTFTDPDAVKWTISYDYLRDADTRYTSQTATYSEEVGRIIDRKVIFRASEKINTTKDVILDPLLIGKAGPFGRLKRTFTLVDDTRTYWDSMMPLVDVSSTIDLTSFDGIEYSQDGRGMGWLLETNEKKDTSQLETSIVTVKFDNNVPALYDSSNTETIDFSYVSDKNDINSSYQVQFPGVTTIDNVVYDALPVTNLFQRDFRGTRDFSRYTGRNLVFGFGDSRGGRHKIRPSVSIWGGFDTSNVAPNMSWPDELILDPPRGIRFGLMGYDESPKYSFATRSFGQLRDMFEQALDTKMSNFESDPKVFGSPVVISAINPTNPEIPKLMENTSRYNKTENATIVKPYIEDNYEGIPNPVNLQSEKLRVDVAGSIKSRQILAPGNVASNIRRR